MKPRQLFRGLLRRNKTVAKPAPPESEAEKGREFERTIQAAVAMNKFPPRCLPGLRCDRASGEEAEVLVARPHRPGDAGPRGRGATSAGRSPDDQSLARDHGEGNFRFPPFRSHTRRAPSVRRGEPQVPLSPCRPAEQAVDWKRVNENTEELRAFLVPPNGGERIENPLGGEVVFKLRGTQTREAMSVFEAANAPTQGPPLHVHAALDELIYVIDGAIRVRLDDRVERAAAGACVFIPRGTPHTWAGGGGGS